MSVPLATRGYICQGNSAQFVSGLSPELHPIDLAPEIQSAHAQGTTMSPGAPIMVIETITDLKPVIKKKPRRVR